MREIREEFDVQPTFLRNNDKPFFVAVTQTVGSTPGHTDVSLWYLLRGTIHGKVQYDRSELRTLNGAQLMKLLKPIRSYLTLTYSS